MKWTMIQNYMYNDATLLGTTFSGRTTKDITYGTVGYVPTISLSRDVIGQRSQGVFGQ